MGGTQDGVWPLAHFSFQVDFGDGIIAGFQSVSGLEAETPAIEYRASNNPAFSTVKMPGLGKVGNVTLKRGVFARNSTLWDWLSGISMNTVRRRTVTIRLLDAAGGSAMAWTLNNAWPTKLTGTDLKSEGNEVAVESIELAFETMVISAP